MILRRISIFIDHTAPPPGAIAVRTSPPVAYQAAPVHMGMQQPMGMTIPHGSVSGMQGTKLAFNVYVHDVEKNHFYAFVY